MTPPERSSPVHRRLQRCQTCCRCGERIALVCFAPRCGGCKHPYCGDCIIDTVEDHEIGITNKGEPVIVHPVGPSKDTYFLLECEERQRDERRQEIGDPELTEDSDRAIQETESSSDDGAIMTPSIQRASRRLPTKIKLEEDSDGAESRPRKMQARPPKISSARGRREDEDVDGEFPINRSETSELLTISELSILLEHRGPTGGKRGTDHRNRAAVVGRVRQKPLKSSLRTK
ncbi:MAG: hypothetical protein Q9181_000711 [Wetmoreana brouardii]